MRDSFIDKCGVLGEPTTLKPDVSSHNLGKDKKAYKGVGDMKDNTTTWEVFDVEFTGRYFKNITKIKSDKFKLNVVSSINHHPDESEYVRNNDILCLSENYTGGIKSLFESVYDKMGMYTEHDFYVLPIITVSCVVDATTIGVFPWVRSRQFTNTYNISFSIPGVTPKQACDFNVQPMQFSRVYQYTEDEYPEYIFRSDVEEIVEELIENTFFMVDDVKSAIEDVELYDGDDE